MTTTYTFEQLKEDVKKEAEALRVHATKEERKKLQNEHFDSSTISGCIYGLMTGCCYSRRAAVLINKCCVRYFTDEVLPDPGEDYITMGHVQKGANGNKVKDFIKARTNISRPHYSAIEAYILLPEAKNANLIAYLKGETDTLEL